MGNCCDSSSKIDYVNIEYNVNNIFSIDSIGNKSVEFQNNKDKKIFNIYHNELKIFKNISIDDSKTEPQLVFSEINNTITNKIQGSNVYYFFIKDGNNPIKLSEYSALYNKKSNDIVMYTLTYRKALLDKEKASIELTFKIEKNINPTTFNIFP